MSRLMILYNYNARWETIAGVISRVGVIGSGMKIIENGTAVQGRLRATIIIK